MYTLLPKLNQKPFDTAVILGAGRDFDPADFCDTSIRKFILVEADPEVFQDLQDSLIGQDNMECVEAFVHSGEGRARFYRYTFSFANGPFSVGRLAEIYPRLLTKGTMDLPVISPHILLEKLQLSPEGSHLLILDLPGQESLLLGADEGCLVKAFDTILFRGCKEPLAEGSQVANSAIPLLNEAGFSLAASDLETDGNWPSFLFERDKLKLRFLELESIIQNLKSQLESETQAKDAQTKLASERQSALEAAVKAKDEQAKLAGERQSALEAAVKERDQFKKTASDRAARIAELEAQVADQAERQKQIDEEMIKAEAQLEMLKEFMRPSFE